MGRVIEDNRFYVSHVRRGWPKGGQSLLLTHIAAGSVSDEKLTAFLELEWARKLLIRRAVKIPRERFCRFSPCKRQLPTVAFGFSNFCQLRRHRTVPRSDRERRMVRWI